MNRFFLSLAAGLLLISVFSCSQDRNSIFITGNETQQSELKSLFRTLREQGHNHESRFILMQRIIQLFQQVRALHLLNLYLTEYVAEFPDDPFTGYYLLIVAYNYKELDAIPFALHYFERIYRNHADLRIQGKSIHYLCLENLVQYGTDPVVLIQYYKALISRYTDEIDIGKNYYEMAETYSELGEWELSLQAYRNFLNYPDSVIPGNPNAYEQVKEMIKYTDLENRFWIRNDLDTLLDEVRSALMNRDVRKLNQLASRISFFTISWLQDKDLVRRSKDAHFTFIDEMGAFMKGRLYAAPELDSESNDQEAYLKTWGWSHRIGTWYLYFRKINFPADPDIHGKWEWAGIYFGEKAYIEN
ncbi:MAG: hypothetical protein JW874_00165 [Spirochaetales bacterium]|nr:hypothetical protein [Spirochaetales bacterium]